MRNDEPKANLHKISIRFKRILNDAKPRRRVISLDSRRRRGEILQLEIAYKLLRILRKAICHNNGQFPICESSRELPEAG
jgi:hypothetical protein